MTVAGRGRNSPLPATVIKFISLRLSGLAADLKLREPSPYIVYTSASL